MERVAVVGSRDGADLQKVYDFLLELREKHPDTILVSGGARGVDHWAEQNWIKLGGRVESYRICQVNEKPKTYGVELWEFGGDEPRITFLFDEPDWANPKSALFYRSMLIAAACDRLVAFYGPLPTRGTGFTLEIAQNEERPTYVFS